MPIITLPGVKISVSYLFMCSSQSVIYSILDIKDKSSFEYTGIFYSALWKPVLIRYNISAILGGFTHFWQKKTVEKK